MDVRITVDSAIDKLKYEVKATMFDNQPWTFSEKETGIKLELTPRVNNDGTVMFAITYRRDNEAEVTLFDRLENRTETPITELIEATETKKPKLPDPKIKLRVSIADPPQLRTPSHEPR